MTDPQSIPLDLLIADHQIRRKLGEFARILDQKSWDRLGDVFAADVRFDYGTGGIQSGMDALTQNMRRFLDGCGPTQHLIGSMIIDVDGDQASSQAYVQARHQRRDDALGPIIDTNGDYHDQWRRGPDGWRITYRHAHWLTHHGDPTILGANERDMG